MSGNTNDIDISHVHQVGDFNKMSSSAYTTTTVTSLCCTDNDIISQWYSPLTLSSFLSGPREVILGLFVTLWLDMEIMALFPKRVIRSETVSWLLPSHLPLPLLLCKVLPPGVALQIKIKLRMSVRYTGWLWDCENWPDGPLIAFLPTCRTHSHRILSLNSWYLW